MNILDENILEGQRRLLQKWNIPFRQIGIEIGRKGMDDREIIRLLLGLRHPTLFAVDHHFYKRDLCHARYGLVQLDVAQPEAAHFLRRVLRHPDFNTHAKRMGVVIRAFQTGLTVWHRNAEHETHYDWKD